MKRFLLTGMVFFSLLVLPEGAVADIYITFDEGGPAVVDFVSTVPLTSAYSSSGVTFSGPSAGQGGAILNQSSNFGVNAHSGSNFLAFNVGTYAKDPETIRFDTLWQTVSIFVSGGTTADTFTMNAYDAYGALVDSDNAETGAIWDSLSVTSIGGIREVVLTAVPVEPGEIGTFVFDDLSASGAVARVPEPTSLILLLAGIAGLAGLRSGRRS